METVRFNTEKNAIKAELIDDVISILFSAVLILGQILWISQLVRESGKSFFDDMSIGLECLFILYSSVNVILGLGLIFMAIPYILWGRFYQIKDYTEVNGNILTQVKFGFPYSKNETSTICHQITSIEASQTTLERIYGIGDVKVKGITKIINEAEEFDLTICGVKNPEEVKKVLVELLPHISSLEVIGKLND